MKDDEDDAYQQRTEQEEADPEVQLTDLAYLFMGRAGVYVVSGSMALGLFAICVLFYLFFAQTLLSIFPIERDSTNYFWSKVGIIVILALAQLPVTLKR